MASPWAGELAGSSALALDVNDEGGIEVRMASWPALRINGLAPTLVFNGGRREPAPAPQRVADATGFTLIYDFSPLKMHLRCESSSPCAAVIQTFLVNEGDQPIVLEDVAILCLAAGRGAMNLGADRQRVRIFEQGNYWGRVRPLASVARGGASIAVATAEPAGDTVQAGRTSELVWVAYDQDAGRALLAGFLSSERWLGRIALGATEGGDVTAWRAGFDAGLLAIAPHQRLELEPLLIQGGEDPWALLEAYADAVSERHPPRLPRGPVVSWCSWYPYRLGVTEDRILENARAAARLRPLGLKIIEVDLGWETGNLPCAFSENDRFGHGLKWLADRLNTMGFELGVWTAPFTISEFDPVAREHPHWLVRDEAGDPAAYWEWFWEPHGKVFILDLTHPGALEWLRQQVQSLSDRGARYLKFDFIGCASDPRAKRRHDPSVVAGGGTEAARRAAAIIRDAAPDALLLNCGGPEMPGTGHWPLLYTCNDTGNSGFIAHQQQAANYQAVACHLFKNRRWGILQPSCLAVGLRPRDLAADRARHPRSLVRAVRQNRHSTAELVELAEHWEDRRRDPMAERQSPISAGQDEWTIGECLRSKTRPCPDRRTLVQLRSRTLDLQQ